MIFGDKNTDELLDTIKSMEAQLISLYEEKTKWSSTANQEMVEMISSLEEQLHSFYSEKENPPASTDSYSAETIRNLEELVISLINEKIDIEANLHSLEKEIGLMHSRTRSLGAAMFEAAVFSSQEIFLKK